MRIANHAQRLVLLDPAAGPEELRVLDVERASRGRFAADPQEIYAHWDEFRDWAATGPRPPPSPTRHRSWRTVWVPSRRDRRRFSRWA